MTISLGVAILICVAVVVLGVVGSGLDLWRERIRREGQRERWQRSKRPSGRP